MNEEEKELTEKNLKQRKEELENLREIYQYNKEQMQLNQMNRMFRERWIKFENKTRQKNEDKFLEDINQQKNTLLFNIKETEKQLKGG